MKNIIIASIIALALVAGATIYVANRPGSCSGSCQPIGSIELSGAYNATTTVSSGAGLHLQVKSSAGMLGSVIIASSSGATLELWNATSTTDIASTSIAKFKASAAEGTYTFDADFPRGIIINPATGFNGNFAITWK